MEKWVKTDFSISNSPKMVPLQEKFNEKQTETDFLLKMRNKYIKETNQKTAIIIQKWVRMIFQRRKYREVRKQKVGSALKIQSIYKMLV